MEQLRYSTARPSQAPLPSYTDVRPERLASNFVGQPPPYEYHRRPSIHLEWLINEYGALTERMIAWERFQLQLLEAVQSCRADVQSCRNDIQKSEQRSVITQNEVIGQLEELKGIGNGNAMDIGRMLQYLEGPPEGSQSSDEQDQYQFTEENDSRVQLRITVPKNPQNDGSGIISQ